MASSEPSEPPLDPPLIHPYMIILILKNRDSVTLRVYKANVCFIGPDK